MVGKGFHDTSRIMDRSSYRMSKEQKGFFSGCSSYMKMSDENIPFIAVYAALYLNGALTEPQRSTETR